MTPSGHSQRRRAWVSVSIGGGNLAQRLHARRGELQCSRMAFLVELLQLPHGHLEDEHAAGSGKVMHPERTPMQVGDPARGFGLGLALAAHWYMR